MSRTYRPHVSSDEILEPGARSALSHGIVRVARPTPQFIAGAVYQNAETARMLHEHLVHSIDTTTLEKLEHN